MQSSVYDSMELASYAPADFEDSEATRPPESYLDSGSQSPATIYSSTVSNILQKQARDIRDRAIPPAQYGSNWRKRIRDIFMRGNETTLKFLTKPIASNAQYSQIENLIRKYSRPDVQNITNTQQLLQDYVSDLSGIDAEFVNVRLAAKVKPDLSAGQNLAEQVKELYEMYRELMEQIGEKDTRLKGKLALLDKIQPRLTMLLDLGVSEETKELQRQIEVYLETVYRENNPEPEYRELLVLYKKFIYVRDLVTLLRLSASPDKEPICGICLNDTVGFVLVPCGHTYCEMCVRRQSASCFMCRQPTSNKVKIFFT
jgi:hypothetical protein